MRYNAYLFSIFILFVAGCTGQINKQTVQRDSMVESSLSAALTASEQFYLGDWPEKQWWTQFNDPQLTELIETALQTLMTRRHLLILTKLARLLDLQRVRFNHNLERAKLINAVL